MNQLNLLKNMKIRNAKFAQYMYCLLENIRYQKPNMQMKRPELREKNNAITKHNKGLREVND